MYVMKCHVFLCFCLILKYSLKFLISEKFLLQFYVMTFLTIVSPEIKRDINEIVDSIYMVLQNLQNYQNLQHFTAEYGRGGTW